MIYIFWALALETPPQRGAAGGELVAVRAGPSVAPTVKTLRPPAHPRPAPAGGHGAREGSAAVVQVCRPCGAWVTAWWGGVCALCFIQRWQGRSRLGAPGNPPQGARGLGSITMPGRAQRGPRAGCRGSILHQTSWARGTEAGCVALTGHGQPAPCHLALSCLGTWQGGAWMGHPHPTSSPASGQVDGSAWRPEWQRLRR